MTSLGENILRLIPGYDPYRDSVGYEFSYERAVRAIRFFQECLHHVEGMLAGKPLLLEPWQQSIIGNLFGWIHSETKLRRYREAFIFVPRKNGKTTLVAGLVNYVLFGDHEPGAQVYLAAAERDQAALCFSQAKAMITIDPILSSKCHVYRKSVELTKELAPGKPSSMKAISSDAHTKHGYNVHCAVVDELHAQPNRELVDVLQTGTVSRRQPLMVYITTSDFERPSICNEKHEYASKVRDGIISDPSFLPAIWEAKVGDDWRSPDTWRKANPNFGVSVSEEYLARECNRAIESPAYENTFKRLHLNIRTEQDVRWLSMDSYDSADGYFADPVGEECYGGLDLASTSDLAAFVLLFPGETMRVLSWFWCPMESARKRDRDARVPYLQWIGANHIKATPGNATDYDVIRSDIAELGRKYRIKEIAFDPWNATQLANQLANDRFEVIKFPQSMGNMSEPSKRLERLIIDGKISFGKNPVMRWMASNVSVREDASGNIRPDKKSSTEKIDGVVAIVMAMGRYVVNNVGPSVYESRGLVTI